VIVAAAARGAGGPAGQLEDSSALSQAPGFISPDIDTATQIERTA
jgi:hypothetical protein